MLDCFPEVMSCVQVILDDPSSTRAEEQPHHRHPQAAEPEVAHHPDSLPLLQPATWGDSGDRTCVCWHPYMLCMMRWTLSVTDLQVGNIWGMRDNTHQTGHGEASHGLPAQYQHQPSACHKVGGSPDILRTAVWVSFRTGGIIPEDN